nr:hypothetical protein [Tanacetum cinerariifolium]
MCHGRLVFSGDANREITVTETFHLQTDDELSDKELKQIEADDQAIQTILLGLPEDIYAAEKNVKLFNEWERFTSNEGESIESYYHHFLKLMNDLKRNKHFPEKIASNLKFLNNLQPEWSRHVTIVYQTKDFHTADYTQLYDFLKYNQKEVDELKAERLAKTQDPLALMANSHNPYVFPAPHQDQSSFNQNYLQQPMRNPEEITDPTTAMNMALALKAKAFKLNYSTPTNNNQRISSNPRNRNQFRQNAGNSAGYNDGIGNQVIQNAVQNPRVHNVGNLNGLIGVQRNGNQNQIGNGNLMAARADGNVAGQNGNQIRCYNCRGVGHYARNCTVRPRRRDAAYLQTQLLIAQKEEAGIQLQAEEYDLMVAVADLNEIEKVNMNCILMANLQQASTSEEQYTELLEPIPESHQVPQNDNNVISADTETLQLAQESRDKMKQMNKKIKPTNYTKINHLSRVFIPQTALSHEELYFSNNSKTANVSKSISIPNEDFSDDTTPSVAHKFLNEVKSTIVTLQRVVKQRMTIKTYNWSSSAHQELHKIIRDENSPIVNQVDARLQNFKIQFLKKAAKFVGDFKSLANEADASLAKHEALELEIKHLLKAVVSQDIISVVQNASVVDTSDLQTELERTKERFENCIIKKENEYAKLWNDWYKKCDECKYDKISYDKAYKDMQQKIKRLQAQLGDLKGKSKDTSCVSDTRNPLSQKLKNENVELEFQDNTCDTSANTKFAKQPIVENLPNIGMFRIIHDKTSREAKKVPNTVSASARTKPITVSQPHVITKKDVNSELNGLSSTGVDNTKTRRP